MSCSESSLQSGEPLYGSAGTCDMEFFYAMPKEEWNKDQVLYSETLPEIIREWYFSQIKSGKRWSFRCYEEPGLPEGMFRLHMYPSGKIITAQSAGELLEMCQRILKGEDGESFPPHKAGIQSQRNFTHSQKTLFICTDGPHDKCCGEFGYQVFRKAFELTKDTGIHVYECSHLGGHKFAATMKAYPSNVMYGRVDTDNVVEVIDAIKTETIYADCYRGRGVLTLEETIAEYVISKMNQENTLRKVDVKNVSEAEKKITVYFANKEEETSSTFKIERKFFEVFGSCRDEAKKSVPRWVIRNEN